MTPADPVGEWLHATCVAIGEAGILLRGPSGSGKSSLALALIHEAGRDGLSARLVGDDRVRLRTEDGRLVASGHPAIAGRIELRGVGIVTVPFQPSAVLRLVVECGGPAPPRLPEPADLVTKIAGVDVGRHMAERADGLQTLRVLWRLRGMDDTLTTVAGSNGRM